MDSRIVEGQDRVRRGRWPVVYMLEVLLVASSAALVVEIVNAKDSTPWNLDLAGPTVSVLVASLVTLVARDQYARSVRPLLRYESDWVTLSEYELLDGGPYRQVRIQNVGPGAALVKRVSWMIELASSRQHLEFEDLITVRDALARIDLREARDYYLLNFSSGTALPSTDDQLYFECTEAAVKAFSKFVVVLEFESLVGDRFVRYVSLLPHVGASSAALKESPGSATV